ncbi:MAG: mechanosensitive ion channel family protein [Gammaproteobacteria bacterium]|jgi:small-conductance mechanosensitive channel|nr:mechanosensitive ion channel family protein [Gammaproteobacteria bacterium]MDH3752057.1 mechanosensitive ion channel family protein [Gammaproteobacteria bacterium]MDH3804797.1 mechanosensitive ion channel family protein [Gammaproteobacteria bacterium]
MIEQVQQLAELIGPNAYLQALAIAVAFILFGKVADWILSRTIGNIAKRSKTTVDDRLVGLLHRPIFLSFVLLGLSLATQRLQMPDAPEFITLGVLKTIAVVVWYNMLRQLTDVLVQTARRNRNSKLVQTGMLTLIQNVFKVVLFALAIYFVFLAWDINVTAWVASAGIVGLALSFAAKDTLSNLFAGVSIIMDAPYKTGDFIILEAGERGVVTHIGLRSTRILTRDDVEITIPNGVIGNSKIINEAGGPSQKHRIRIAVGAAYGSDIDHVVATLEQVAADNPGICSDPAPRVRFRQFGDSSIDFELLCWIAKPVDRGRLRHELGCSVYKAFAANNIEIPFPQRDLHVRTMPDTA